MAAIVGAPADTQARTAREDRTLLKSLTQDSSALIVAFNGAQLGGCAISPSQAECASARNLTSGWPLVTGDLGTRADSSKRKASIDAVVFSIAPEEFTLILSS